MSDDPHWTHFFQTCWEEEDRRRSREKKIEEYMIDFVETILRDKKGKDVN